MAPSWIGKAACQYLCCAQHNYCFFIINYDRRSILHFNITRHPTSEWIVQQLREAFPYHSAPRFLIFDRDGKYGTEVPAAVRSMKIHAFRTSFESPRQAACIIGTTAPHNQKATRGELLARFYWEQMTLAQIANFSGRLRVSQLNGYEDRM